VAFSADGTRLACTAGTAIRVWKVDGDGSRECPQEREHPNEVRSLAFSPDDHFLASADAGGQVVLWATPTLQRLGDLLAPPPNAAGAAAAPAGPNPPVIRLAFSADSALLAFSGGDGQVRLWDVGLEAWKARARRVANRPLSEKELALYLPPERP
jgi:WD40 repeat protein